MAATPIASLQRLKELGLDPAQYGSCSEPEQRSIKNRGRVWINRGCQQFHGQDGQGCPWRDNTQFIQPREVKHGEAPDNQPRPRNVVTTFIKPNSTGPGDRIIRSYCACFQFLGGLKRRDGKNNEISEAVGGEGESVTVKTDTKTQNPDGTFYFKPGMKKITVPRFPDPTEVDELFEDVYAGQARIEHKARTVDADRQRRIEGAIVKDVVMEDRSAEVEGLSITEVDPRSVPTRSQ